MTTSLLILVICTLANHLGFIEAIERVCHRTIPIVNCCKCSTFWASLLYLVVTRTGIIHSIFIAFILSYLAVWLELILGILDSIYYELYKKIITNNSESETDTNTKGPTNA